LAVPQGPSPNRGSHHLALHDDLVHFLAFRVRKHRSDLLDPSPLLDISIRVIFI